MKLRGNDRAYEYALSLLNQNWRNLYMNGLVFYLLNSWNSLESHYRELTSKLLIEKLKAYTDSNRRYLCLKDHANLFEEAGPYRLAALLIQRGLRPIDAPKILGYKESAINQSYYSDVIIRYVKNKDIHDLDTVEEIFEYHNLDRTRKLVLAHLVEREDRNPDGLKRTQLCRFVNRILGDVTLASTWAPFIGASDEEAQRLKRAMTLVNNWFTQQIIETFFEICVQDENRKRFWLNYVNVISGFKIVGSAIIKSLLLSDSRIGTLFIKHFIETNSHTSQTSALILFIKDKMLVEFSDTGALYVYNHNHSQVKMVLQRRGWITSTNDLKVPSMGALIYSDNWGSYSFYEEGRMPHQGDWVKRLTMWLQRKLLCKEIAYSPFYLNKEENIFKAKPVPVESIVSNFPPSQQVPEKETITNSGLDESIKKKCINVNNTCNINQQDIKYKLYSKEFIENYIIVANTKGFYLCHQPSNELLLLAEYDSSVKFEGYIFIKKAYYPDWYQFFHCYTGYMKSIGFLKKEENGTFLFSKNKCGEVEKVLSFTVPTDELKTSQNIIQNKLNINLQKSKDDKRIEPSITNKTALNRKNDFSYNVNKVSILKNITYKIYSKEFIVNFMIVANGDGFYLCHRPSKRFILLTSNDANISLKGYIWLKKGYYPGWFEIFHCYTGNMKSICYIKQENEGTFSFSSSKCGQVEKTLSFD